MEHSIAAKYAARPVARFVRPSVRDRERRLGLVSHGTFQATSTRETVLRRADLGPLVQLRASSRSIRAAAPRRTSSGQPRPVVTIHWARSGRSGNARRARAASAPWHA